MHKIECFSYVCISIGVHLANRILNFLQIADERNGVEEGKYGGYPGGGGGYNHGGRGGYRGYPPRRGYCDNGCCRGYRYSNECHRCCAHAKEAPDAEFEDDVKN